MTDPQPATPVHLLDLTADELRAWLADAGQPRYRTEQILDWIYRKHATDFDAMTNLSKPLRGWLNERAALYRSTLTTESVSDDATRKLLLTLPDGGSVETVWIPVEHRNTACLSSQVGCPVGCTFCASGLDGLQRNLTAGEIVEQALRIQQLIADNPPEAAEEFPAADVGRAMPADAPADRLNRRAKPALQETDAPTDRAADRTDDRPTAGPRLSHIVMMGMGEPLANYAAVVKALRTINAPWGLGIGARRITLSTVGLPKQIRALANEDLQLNLALSLHATDDGLRQELVPWASGVKIADLLDACRYYFQQTGREVTFEYVLLADVNMKPSHADALAKMAKRLRANVNLLRYNRVAGLPFRRPTSSDAHAFQQRLRDQGVTAHIRTSRGRSVDAACGQLRRRNLPLDPSIP